VTKAMNERLGTKYVTRLKDTMLELSGLGERRPMGTVSRFLNTLTGNVAKSILSWNPGSYINNRHGGALMYASELWHEDRALAAKFSALVGIPVNLGNWIGGTENRQKLEYLMENGYLAERWGYDVTQVYIPVRGDRVDSGLGFTHKLRVGIRWIQQKGLQPMKHAEQRNAIILYNVLTSAGRSPAEARDVVESMTRSTQNSSSALEDSAFIRGLRRSGFGGIFPFMTQAVVARNLIVRDYLAMTRDGKVSAAGIEKLAVSVAAVVVSGIALQFLLNAARSAITGGGGKGGDDPEKEMKQLGGEFSLQVIENLFLPARPIIEVINGSMEGMRSTGGMLLFDRPIANLFGTLGKYLGEAAGTGAKEPSHRELYSAAVALLQVAGLPTGGPGLAARAAGLDKADTADAGAEHKKKSGKGSASYF